MALLLYRLPAICRYLSVIQARSIIFLPLRDLCFFGRRHLLLHFRKGWHGRHGGLSSHTDR